jgi:hypothetical protein
MKYFVYQLSHDNGITFGKTNGSELKSVKKSIEEYELCPPSAIKIKEVPFCMVSFPSDQLWKLYDKPFKIKMVNRRAVKIVGYVGHSARIKYIDTGQECSVSRTVIKEFKPKSKTKK